MKQFFKNLFSSSGEVSSKRFVTIFAFILMAIGFISNLFWNQDIEKTIYDSMQWIVLGGMGLVASEKFSNRNNVEAKPMEEPINETGDNEVPNS